MATIKMDSLGSYIRVLRKESSLTLTKLAASLDLDQSSLSKIENNKKEVPYYVIPKLAEVFNLDLNELECQYYSERIAALLKNSEDSGHILDLVRSKISKQNNEYKL